MGAIAEILRTHFGAYLKAYGDKVPAQHVKAANAIINCRTGAYGVSLFECEHCGEMHTVNNCCGNRHCPSCQQHKNFDWVRKQKDKLLPVPYFMVTFTVPQQVRRFIRSNQKVCYASMFKAASETLKKLMKDQRHVGAETPGFLGVLHTWGRDLNYHPHIHFIIPGGGLSKDKSEWKSSGKKFLIPVEAASTIFRAKFYDAVEKEGLGDEIDRSMRFKGWNVNVKAMGDGQKALDYLAPYVFKVAISDSRIVCHDAQKVVIKVKRTDTKKVEQVAFTPFEFIRRFLQHVLPDGFMKVRHYGFLSANPALPIDDIRRMIDELWTELELLAKREEPQPPPQSLQCGCGSHKLKFIFHTWRNMQKPPG